jgi:Ca2+-dependent lipid-binding protein
VPSAYQLHATSDTVHNNNNNNNNNNTNNVQNQPIIETGKWFNVVAERFFLNIRESEEVEKKLVSKLITKFSEKLTEKGWGDMISQMSITDVELGTKPPTIEEVAILPPDGTGDLALDVTLSYSGGGAKLSIAADVNFKNFFSTTVT